MDEIEEWFIDEFSEYGFSVGPPMLNPHNFVPTKSIMLTHNGQMRKTRTSITTDMISDVLCYDPVGEYKSLIRWSIHSEFGEDLSYLINDYKPNKYIPKHKFY